MLYKSILILVCLHLYLNSHGQQFQLSGHVYSQEEGPVSEVSVLNIRTSSGTVSDVDGNFQIKARKVVEKCDWSLVAKEHWEKIYKPLINW